MSILTHSPAIVRDGLVLCLDAGAEQSWPSSSGGTDSNWGAEILVDGGFETWSSSTALTHWSKYIAGSSTVNRDSAEEESGTYCLRLDVDGSDSNTLVYSSVACFVPGRHYRVKFSAKCSSGTLNASVYESTAATVPDNGIPDTVLPLTTSYQSFVIDFTAHGNSGANQNLLFGRRSGGGGASKSIYFDNASVRELHWHDLSGNFNNAPLTNAPIFSAESGAGGTKSFDFDGSSDKMSIVTASIAIHCFQIAIRFDDIVSKAAVGFTADGVHFNGLTIGPWTGTMDDETIAWWGYGTGAGSGAATYIKTVVSTDWHIITANWTGSTSTGYDIWIDGVKQTVYARGGGSGHSGLLDGVTAMHIGWNEGWNNYLNGRIAFVRAYNRSLTDTEIQQNYRAHKGRFGK